MGSMQSIVIAAISGLNGNNVVIDKDGNIQFLQEGMTLSSGDVLITDGQGHIESDDTQISVDNAGVARITEDGALDALALDDDIAQIFEALESGQDPTQLSEEFATAAGGVQGSSLTASQAIERIGAETLAQTAFDTSSLESQGLSQTQSMALAQAIRLFVTAVPVSTDDGRELDAPGVSIIDGGDNYLNDEEIKDGLAEVVITLPDRTDVSTDVLVVDFNDGNGPQEFPLNELTVTDGTVTLPIPTSELVHDNTIQIDAQIQVPSGGLSDTGSDTTQVDLHVGPGSEPVLPTIDGISADSGVDGDFITNDNTLVINGTVELAEGDKLTVNFNGQDYTTDNGLVINADGTWTLDVTGTELADGSYEVTATVTDVAGNSDKAEQTIVIDTQIGTDGDDTTPAVSIDGITEDRGESNSDFVTNDNTLSINGKVELATGDRLTVNFNGTDYTTDNGLVINADGTWTLDVTGTELADGSYEVTATVTDVAGNSGKAEQTIVIDTEIGTDGDDTTPAVSIDGITEDRGESASDFVTNDNTLVINGTVELAEGDKLTVNFNGQDYTTDNGLVINADGTWTLDVTGTELADGSYDVTATVTDVAGNSDKAEQTIVIDTNIGTPDPKPEPGESAVSIDGITEDRGDSASDFITNDNTLIINGKVELAEGDSLSVNFNGMDYTTDNGLVINADGTWTLDVTGTELADGSYEVMATVTDVAGNEGSAKQTIVIDTEIGTDGDDNTPAVSIDGITEDRGESASDFITNDNTLVINGKVELATGDSLTVNFNGMDYTTDNGLVINADGTWTLDVTGTELADGSYEVTATVTDVAGNEGSAKQTIVIDTEIGTDGDDNTPAVSIDGITEDRGESNSDFITNDNTLIINGKVELATGDSLTVNFNGQDYTTDNGLVINADGTWTLDVTGTELADGSYEVTATVTDVAGNSGKAEQTIVIDTEIGTDGDDTTPAVSIDGITEDRGESASDFVTNDNTLVINGTVELAEGDKLTVNFNGQDYTTDNGLVINADGTWTLDVTGTELADGSYDVTATVTDVAGNSDKAEQTIVIDTNIGTPDPKPEPGESAVSIDGITEDRGDSASDFITNDNTLIINGKVELAEGDSLSVNFNGMDYTTDNGLVINADGTWTLDVTGTELADGSYEVMATVTDVAGNEGSAKQTIVIDTEIGTDGDDNTPAVSIDGITEDRGESASDFITNDNTLVINGKVELATGDSLTVNFNGMDYTTDNGLVINADGTWTLDVTGTELADGSYEVTATVTDVAGNEGSAKQTIVIDTEIGTDGDDNTPAVSIDGITEDRGESNSDFITNDNTLIINGKVELATGDSLTVNFNGQDYTTDNGLVINADGTWTLDVTGTELADGSYEVTATVTDVAGNEGSAKQTIVIDTEIGTDGDDNTPAVSIDGITEDRGESTSDFITNDNTLVINGKVELATGDRLTVNFNGQDYTTDNGLVINADGTWTLDVTGTELADGSYDVTATVTDVAGNSDKAEQTIVIDTNIGTPDPKPEPGESAVSIDGITEDRGDSASDFITNDNTLVISGTVELAEGDKLAVNFNGQDYTIDNGLVINADGTWMLDVTGTELADGSYDVTATVTDVAGNSDKAEQTIVIDTQIGTDGDDTTPAVSIDGITEDRGESASDFITNDNTLVINGKVELATGDSLSVNFNGQDYTTDNGLVINADGTWTLDVTGTELADGSYEVTATVTDVAGNEGSAKQTIVIDTEIGTDGDDITPAVSIDGITEDRGESNSDFVTNDNTLVINGKVELATGDKLTVNFNGQDYTTDNGLVINADGTWTLDVTGTELADGSYDVTATVTDVAGNSDKAEQTIVIDTNIGTPDPKPEPGESAVSIDGITEDRGESASDFITNDNTLIINGKVELATGDRLTVNFNGQDYTTDNGLVINADGTWTLDVTGTELADGSYEVTATVTDVAGNEGSAKQTIVIDTDIGTDGDDNTPAVSIDGITEDRGESNSDFITNDNTLIINGKVELATGDRLTVNFNGQDYTTDNGLVVNADGTWTLDVTGTELADGSYEVTATVTDVAGNSDKAEQTIVIDTQIGTDGDDTTPAVTIDGITEDRGESASDFITNDNTLIINGKVELAEGDSLSVNFNGTDYTTDNGLVINADGTWTLDVTGIEQIGRASCRERVFCWV